MFAMPAFSTCFAIVVRLTADSVFSYGKLHIIIIIIIVKYIIFHAFNSSGSLQSLYHWTNQNQRVLV